MIMFELIPGLPEGATGWMGTLYSMASSALTFFIYLIPIILIGGAAIGIFVWMKYKKRYDTDVIIKVITNNNIVVQHDRGGVFKNIVGGSEFRLMKSKVSIPVPDRSKFWMLNNKGKFTIELFKMGEDDYLPIENRIKLRDKIKGYINPDKAKVIASDKFTPIDAKNLIMDKLADLDYIPVPSPTKSHLLMKTRENIIKHQRQGKMEKYLAFLPFIIIIAAFIFLVIYYFKVAGELVNNNQYAGKECLQESQKVLQSIRENCIGGSSYRPETIPPNPLSEAPPV